MTMPIAVVPLRAGKTRLASAYGSDARRALRAAMLADVVEALRNADVGRIVVACADPESEAIAAPLPVVVHRDPPAVSGLDAALASAVAANAGKGDDVLIVTADLPTLVAGDVHAVIAAPGPVVVAPTSDGGTGALLRRPHDSIPTAYGPNSGARHARLATDAGIAPVVLDLPGFRIDVDTEADLAELDAAPSLGRHTASWLAGVVSA